MIARLSQKIEQYLSQGYTKIFFGGSFCRGAPLCHDLDIAIQCDIETIMRFRNLPDAQQIKCQGDTINRLIVEFEGQQIQVDLWRFPEYNWGVGCMFVAGNGKLNMIQRAQAKRQGYKLGFSLQKLDEPDKDIPLPTEQEVYRFLNWPWLPYEHRNIQ